MKDRHKANRLAGLRAWQTIPETARLLSETLDEHVIECDVLRLALDGQLRLSVRFSDVVAAKLYREPPKSEVHGNNEQYKQYLSLTDAPNAAGVPIPGFARKVSSPVKISVEDNFEEILFLGESTYDLPLKGRERLHVKQVYRSFNRGIVFLETGYEPENGYKPFEAAGGALAPIVDTLVEAEDGTRFVPLERVAEALAAQLRTHDLLDHYRPAESLPDDCVLVVRTNVLRQLTARALAKAGPDKELGQRERSTLLQIIKALAMHADIDLARPSKAAGIIAKMTESTGVAVSQRAIENHLKNISNDNRGS